MGAAAAAAALAVAALTPLWHVCGRGAQHLNLPAITGIMLVCYVGWGVKCGPGAPGGGAVAGCGVAAVFVSSLPHQLPFLPPSAFQAGVASGPYVLGLLSAASVASLSPLMHACLSLIALAAGAELHLPELQRLRKQVRSRLAWLVQFCCHDCLLWGVL